MFRSRITLEEYLKSVEHEVAAGEDISLDDINMDTELEENDDDDDVEINEQDDLHSKVFANVNHAHISIPEDFKDDQEVLVIGKIILEKCTLYFLLYYDCLKVLLVNDIRVVSFYLQMNVEMLRSQKGESLCTWYTNWSLQRGLWFL